MMYSIRKPLQQNPKNWDSWVNKKLVQTPTVHFRPPTGDKVKILEMEQQLWKMKSLLESDDDDKCVRGASRRR